MPAPTKEFPKAIQKKLDYYENRNEHEKYLITLAKFFNMENEQKLIKYIEKMHELIWNIPTKLLEYRTELYQEIIKENKEYFFTK